MSSIVQCPHCKAQFCRWVHDNWNPVTGIYISTYQCRQCLNLYDIKFDFSEEDKSENDLATFSENEVC